MKFLHWNTTSLPLDWILNRRKYFPKWLIFDQIIPFCSAGNCTVFVMYPENLETNFHWAKLPHFIRFSLHILSFRWFWKLPFWAVLIANKWFSQSSHSDVDFFIYWLYARTCGLHEHGKPKDQPQLQLLLASVPGMSASGNCPTDLQLSYPFAHY